MAPAPRPQFSAVQLRTVSFLVHGPQSHRLGRDKAKHGIVLAVCPSLTWFRQQGKWSNEKKVTDCCWTILSFHDKHKTKQSSCAFLLRSAYLVFKTQQSHSLHLHLGFRGDLSDANLWWKLAMVLAWPRPFSPPFLSFLPSASLMHTKSIQVKLVLGKEFIYCLQSKITRMNKKMKLSSTEQHCTKTGVKSNSSWSKASHTDYQKVGKAEFENIFNILWVGLFRLGSGEHIKIL